VLALALVALCAFALLRLLRFALLRFCACCALRFALVALLRLRNWEKLLRQQRYTCFSKIDKKNVPVLPKLKQTEFGLDSV
jgi:hypothetical protein